MGIFQKRSVPVKAIPDSFFYFYSSHSTYNLKPFTLAYSPNQLTPGMLYISLCNMSTLEIEVKFFLADMEILRHRLQQYGARSAGRVFEYNICFENAAQGLHRTQSLLRLRKDNKTTLTYKTKPAGIDIDFKVLKELEVKISDFDTMAGILKALGFHQEQVYEKYRETFTLGSTEICLDSMPYGDFLEIEGRKEDIRQLARQLDMPWHHRILWNYRCMFTTLKENLNLGFIYITFDNFRDVELEFETFQPLFEAG